MSAEARLSELGLTLPPVKAPIASYVSARRDGNYLHLSGQGARMADGSVIKGKVGRDLDTAQAAAAARTIGLQLLATIRDAAGTLDGVEVIKLLGLINATDDFTEHPLVINGCSDLLVEVLGEQGKHARSAMGVASLPFGIPVEIELLVRLPG